MGKGGARPSHSQYWLLISSGAEHGARVRAFALSPAEGERTLLVFSSGERAEAFLRSEVSEGGWRAWETRAGELLSVLSTSRFSTGPCADVSRVALDPPPDGALSREGYDPTVSRRDFMEHLMGRKSLI